MDAVVGNSSSGLAEAPSFNIATIDIGDRQKGRIKADSVISCKPTKESIDGAFRKSFSEEFKNVVVNTRSPYGNGGASKIVAGVIKDLDLNGILKKSFYSIKDSA